MSLFEKNWKLVLGLCAIIILGGAGLAVQSAVSTSSEKAVQEKFFIIEKKYTDYKTKMEMPDKPKADKSTTPAAAINPKPTAEVLKMQLATVKQDFEKFISDSGKSKAAQMAALYLAEILRQERNNDLALTTLQKVETKDSGLVNTLVQQQIGQLLADGGKCSEAIALWGKIIARKEASFLHNDLKIQQALCYQKLNDSKKAEELLTNIANQKSEGPADSPTVKEAAKYLRLLQIRKVTGT